MRKNLNEKQDKSVNRWDIHVVDDAWFVQTWDAGYGYELRTQYKTGTLVVSLALLTTGLLASIPYWS